MKILVVEDEHKIAAAIKKGLEQESYAVDTAFNGSDGLDLALTESYDLMILDLMLPGMNGLGICTQVRNNNIHTPILILTAKSELDDKVNVLNAGADDYLTKPFAFEELLARIKALLRRPHETTNNIFTCGSLTVNTNTYEVKRKNVHINLSKREYALLEYLIRNKGKILTKDQITQHVWSYDSDILPNTVEQYIGYLRTKIDKAFNQEPQIITTIRGFGYKVSD